MKNLSAEILFSRNSKWNLVLGIVFFAAFVLACGGSSAPKKPIPEAYLGSWTAQDGTTLNIRADNTGDYKAGSSNVEGAAVEVDEATKEIRFTMIGVDVGKYKIDSPPSGNQMKLSGQTYRRSGGFAPAGKETISNRGAKTDDDTTAASDAEMPDDMELQSLVKTTLLDFNSAVQAGDFSTFHSTVATTLQQEVSSQKFEEAFAQFIEQKIDIGKISAMQATFSPKPSFGELAGMNVLNVAGSYPTRPATNFDLKYTQEDGEWKLVDIKVRIK